MYEFHPMVYLTIRLVALSGPIAHEAKLLSAKGPGSCFSITPTSRTEKARIKLANAS